MIIRIVGIQMHAYKDRLEELRRVAPGTVVFLTREDNGPVRRHSIRAMLGNECLGYVKRLEINKVRDIMGRRSALQARILSLCDDELAFCAEIDGESTVAPIDINHELDGWTPLGPILEPTNLELNLQAWINILSAMSETPGDWTPENEAQLQLVMDNAWIDMSGETHLQLAEIIGLLMAAPEESKQSAGLKLDRTFSRYGRDEYRQRRFEYLRELSQSEQMARILCNNTESIMDWMTDVPDPYEKEFYSDPLTLMRLLWYADLPKDKLQALLTRVCMKIAVDRASKKYKDPQQEELEEVSSMPSPLADDEAAGAAPHFHYFCPGVSEAERESVELMLRQICSKKNSCSDVVRYLRRKIREGIIMDMFPDKKKLLENLREFGLKATYKTLQNAATRNP